jgi:hypothetical protein
MFKTGTIYRKKIKVFIDQSQLKTKLISAFKIRVNKKAQHTQSKLGFNGIHSLIPRTNILI